MDYKNIIAENLCKHIDMEKETIENLLKTHQNQNLLYLHSLCFQLAKSMKKAPNMIA